MNPRLSVLIGDHVHRRGRDLLRRPARVRRPRGLRRRHDAAVPVGRNDVAVLRAAGRLAARRVATDRTARPAMDKLWTDLLTFINQLVSPDWGALVALVPILLVLLVVALRGLADRAVRECGPDTPRQAPSAPEAAGRRPRRGNIVVAGPRPPSGCSSLLAGFVFKGWVSSPAWSS